MMLHHTLKMTAMTSFRAEKCCRLLCAHTASPSAHAQVHTGTVCWNSLPDYLKSSDLSFNCFRQQLKTLYFVNIDTSPSTTLMH